MYEVEQKFPVADPAALEARLVGLAARFREPVEQVDRYFAHPCRDFVKTDEALRLRRVGDDVAATWKGPRIDSASKTRRELELGLAPVPPLPGGPRGGQATLDRWTELLEAESAALAAAPLGPSPGPSPGRRACSPCRPSPAWPRGRSIPWSRWPGP